MKKRLLEILGDPLRGFNNLTDKEREVARLASRGLFYYEIAEAVSSTDYAITAVLRSIYTKTGMNKNDLIKHLIKQIDKVIN